MCRSCDEGGRRCPSSRGERRRAYQRARYAASAEKRTFDSSHTRGGRSVAPDPAITPVSEMTREERIVVQSAARDRIDAHRARVADVMDVIAGELGMTTEELTANSKTSRGSLLGSHDSRSELVRVNQELGRDVSLAAECAFQNRLEELGLDDKSAWRTTMVRMETHPDAKAGDLYTAAQGREKALSKSEGRDTLRERLDSYYRREIGFGSGDDLDPDKTPPVTNEELQRFLSEALGKEFTDEMARKSLSGLRSERADMLNSEARRLQEDYDWYLGANKRAEETGRAPFHSEEKMDKLREDLSNAVREADKYDPSPADPWPRDAREQRAMEQELRINIETKSMMVKRIVLNEANDTRLKVRDAALREELSRVQTFGGQTIEPFATGGKVTKAIRKQFDDSVDLYPSGMVAQAKENFPRLVFRQTKKRAHFNGGSRQKWSEKSDQYIEVPSLDTEPSQAFAYGIDSSYDKEEASRVGHPVTTENREKMQAIADAHNEGLTVWTVPGKKTRWGGSEPRVLMVDEINDEDGNPRLVLRSKNKISRQVYGSAAELTTDGELDTTLHELAHMMEDDPQVYYPCKQFLYDRTRDKESVVYNKSRKYGTEKATPDGFANTYIGKDYSGQANTEVFSMGMEGIFAAGRGGCRGVEEIAYVTDTGMERYSGTIDTEHRDLILGILAGYRADPEGPMTTERASAIKAKMRDRSSRDDELIEKARAKSAAWRSARTADTDA